MKLLSDALFLARKDVKYLMREKETMLWTFVMPVVFFFFIGSITGGFAGGGDSVPNVALWVEGEALPNDIAGGFLVEHLERRSADRGYNVVLPETEADFDRYLRQLRVPGDFTERVLAGEAVELEFRRLSSGMDADYDEVRLSRAVYSILADLIVTEEEGGELTPEALEALAAAERTVTLKVVSAGERIEPPTGFEQAIPGTMVMFTLLVLFTGGAVMLVQDRELGLLRRLASAPMSRGSVVLGKWLARMALGLIQIAFAMLAGTLIFGMQWGDQLPALLVLLFAYAAMAASLALLVGNFMRTQGQAIALGVIGTNVLAALGGCWWPIEITPAFMQKLALFLPTGLAMNGLHKLVSFGHGADAVILHVLIFAAAAIALGWLTARRFRFQ